MVITRRSKPTRLDCAPKGTKCKVIVKNHDFKNGEIIGEDEHLLYIQINKDESNPVWELINE